MKKQEYITCPICKKKEEKTKCHIIPKVFGNKKWIYGGKLCDEKIGSYCGKYLTRFLETIDVIAYSKGLWTRGDNIKKAKSICHLDGKEIGSARIDIEKNNHYDIEIINKEKCKPGMYEKWQNKDYKNLGAYGKHIKTEYLYMSFLHSLFLQENKSNKNKKIIENIRYELMKFIKNKSVSYLGKKSIYYFSSDNNDIKFFLFFESKFYLELLISESMVKKYIISLPIDGGNNFLYYNSDKEIIKMTKDEYFSYLEIKIKEANEEHNNFVSPRSLCPVE